LKFLGGQCREDEVFPFIVGALLNLTFFFRLRFFAIEEKGAQSRWRPAVVTHDGDNSSNGSNVGNPRPEATLSD
jgi:hypothetical protein